MASVVIRDVRKAFGLTPVIHGVTITIEDGEDHCCCRSSIRCGVNEC